MLLPLAAAEHRIWESNLTGECSRLCVGGSLLAICSAAELRLDHGRRGPWDAARYAAFQVTNDDGGTKPQHPEERQRTPGQPAPPSAPKPAVPIERWSIEQPFDLGVFLKRAGAYADKRDGFEAPPSD